MNIFIVFAHPNPHSFNGALKECAVKTLMGEGHQVKVSDLYEMKFKCVADENDFQQVSDLNFLKYAAEQKHACQTNSFSPDIITEQEKLLWADLVIFQFPLWWYSVPAILKGWFDRVLASGFSYGSDIGRYDTGGLKGRKALLSLTTGSPKEAYTPYGMDGDMYEKILYPINHGILFFNGLTPLEPFISWTPSHQEAQRKLDLQEFERILKHIQNRPSIVYHQTKDYDEHHQLLKQYRT